MPHWGLITLDGDVMTGRYGSRPDTYVARLLSAHARLASHAAL